MAVCALSLHGPTTPPEGRSVTRAERPHATGQHGGGVSSAGSRARQDWSEAFPRMFLANLHPRRVRETFGPGPRGSAIRSGRAGAVRGIDCNVEPGIRILISTITYYY